MESSAIDRLNKRQKEILELLQARGDISISELAEKYKVHTMTIRRDIQIFQDMGLVVRTYGGAMGRDSGRGSLRYLSNEDITVNIEKKIEIARYIVEKLVHDGDLIFLDSGSTMLQIAKMLINRKKITVLTNSIDIMAELYHQQNINTLIVGGNLSRESSVLHGPYAIQQLKLEAQKLTWSFLSCDAIQLGPNGGFYTNHAIEADLNQYASRTGIKKCIAADSTKIGKLCQYKFADFKDIDVLITDSNIKKPQVDEIESHGILVYRGTKTP
jgi:DeoR/GlpR family transcriptional regulator of sugar metabolism